MNETWIELTVKTTTEAVEAISNILIETGAEGVMIEDPKDFLFQKAHDYDWDYVDENLFKTDAEDSVNVKTFLTEDTNIVEFVNIVKSRLATLPSCGLDIGAGEVSLGSIKKEDWANNWKKYYKPTRIGENIIIKPEWEDYDAKDGDLIVEMNPGMAFGTGNHETTNMCVENLEKFVTKDSTVFDIGCGSGILGITAAKLGAKKVIGIDIDEVAVEVANENIEKNHVEDVMTAVQGNLADDIDKSIRPDVVVANIIADIIIILAKDVREFLDKGKIFISSGIILAKVDEVVEALEKEGFEIVEVIRKGEWACVVAK